MKTRFWIAAGLGVSCLLALPQSAHAEVTLVKPADNWEIYTTGRVSAFGSYIKGNGLPTPVAKDPNHVPVNGGIDLASDSPPPHGETSQFRVRNGFLGNIFSIGARNHLTPLTTLTAQLSVWSVIESNQQRTYNPSPPDVREGFFRVEGPGGTLTAGRALSLFGRGATEIDFLYGHGYGVGAPQGFNSQGPTAGHIGFGVLANVFVAGIAYATPKFAGLQLNVGYYEPAVLVGVIYRRTKLGRPEAELTYDAELGPGNKLHLFADGAFQKLYSTQPDQDDSKNVYGAQVGGRVELGPFHLGVAGFSGKGLGVNYFLSQNDSILNKDSNEFRPVDGGYVQAQVSVQKFDFNAGLGITRIHQMTQDLDLSVSTTQPDYLKQQRGISAVVVYHITPYFHGALDYFRADTTWWAGETQAVNSVNLGATATW